jgi:hypothetical protein
MSDTGYGAVGLRRPTPLLEARLIFPTARCVLSVQVCPSPMEQSLAFSICWKAVLRFATTSNPPIVGRTGPGDPFWMRVAPKLEIVRRKALKIPEGLDAPGLWM